MIFVNFYTNRSDITYELSNSPDLQKVKPIFVSNEELDKIKECTYEQVLKIIETNKF